MMARHWFASSFGSTANERKRQAPNPALPLLLQDVFGFFPGWATSPVFFCLCRRRRYRLDPAPTIALLTKSQRRTGAHTIFAPPAGG